MKERRAKRQSGSVLFPEFDVTFRTPKTADSGTWQTIFSDVAGTYRSQRDWNHPPSMDEVLEHFFAFLMERPGGLGAALDIFDSHGLAQLVDAIARRYRRVFSPYDGP